MACGLVALQPEACQSTCQGAYSAPVRITCTQHKAVSRNGSMKPTLPQHCSTISLGAAAGCFRLSAFRLRAASLASSSVPTSRDPRAKGLLKVGKAETKKFEGKAKEDGEKLGRWAKKAKTNMDLVFFAFSSFPYIFLGGIGQ